MTAADTLLSVERLTVEYVPPRGFWRRRGAVRVLEDFSLDLRKGETLGIVGESGCGKSTLAQSIARFIPARAGEIRFESRNIFAFDRAAMRRYRQQMQLVFQNPFSSLNPHLRVGSVVAEPLLTHRRSSRHERNTRVASLLAEMGLPGEIAGRYPHELSGGQAQRVALARALALNPKLLLLDEPTSALDVSVQAQILNLLARLQRSHDLTYMLISHNLGVVQHVCDRVAVLYLGEIVELAPRDDIFRAPRHPYTQALMASTPVPDPARRRQRTTLAGTIPSLADPPAGCRFHTRCPHAMERCRREKPAMHHLTDGHWATCHLLDGANDIATPASNVATSNQGRAK